MWMRFVNFLSVTDDRHQAFEEKRSIHDEMSYRSRSLFRDHFVECLVFECRALCAEIQYECTENFEP